MQFYDLVLILKLHTECTLSHGQLNEPNGIKKYIEIVKKNMTGQRI